MWVGGRSSPFAVLKENAHCFIASRCAMLMVFVSFWACAKKKKRKKEKKKGGRERGKEERGKNEK